MRTAGAALQPVDKVWSQGRRCGWKRTASAATWSTGQVEGQINWLKMIKRQMYSRANLDLLGRCFLLAA